MNLKLTTGVRDQKAAGSNPATSTRVKPLQMQGFFFLPIELPSLMGAVFC